MPSRLTTPHPVLTLLLVGSLLTVACLDLPDEAVPPGDDDYTPAVDDDDATEDPWDDPVWNGDDDDSAIAGQLGVVSFSYNFEVTGDDYWDCQRRYRWMEQPDEPAGGCADCLTTWRVKYEVIEDSCGPWGWNGNGYELNSGLDPLGNWLWFTHDEGSNWLRFPGQGTILENRFTASWTWKDDCFDIDSNGECDPGSEMSYRELFDLTW